MKLGSQGSNRKDLGGKSKNNSHAATHGRAPWMEVSCPTLGCSRNVLERQVGRKPIGGNEVPPTCPNCHEPIPRGGYVIA